MCKQFFLRFEKAKCFHEYFKACSLSTKCLWKICYLRTTTLLLCRKKLQKILNASENSVHIFSDYWNYHMIHWKTECHQVTPTASSVWKNLEQSFFLYTKIILLSMLPARDVLRSGSKISLSFCSIRHHHALFAIRMLTKCCQLTFSQCVMYVEVVSPSFSSMVKSQCVVIAKIW